jgi:hypothetical protein
MTASARSYLVQQTQRLRLAAKTIISELDQIELRSREVKNDLCCLISALDENEEELLNGAA